MRVEWSAVWESAVAGAEEIVRARSPAARKYVRGIMQAREQRLRLIMLAWADGALDEATLESELTEEQDIIETEFLAVRAMVKKAAQDASKAVFKIIGEALLKGITVVA